MVFLGISESFDHTNLRDTYGDTWIRDDSVTFRESSDVFSEVSDDADDLMTWNEL